MSERINLTPGVWGPKTWFFLDSMAMGYPENPTDDEKLSAKNLILSLKDLLPCWGCRVNYAKYLEDYIKTKPLDKIVENRGSLIEFIIAVHNDVRERNGDKVVSVEDTFKYYNKEYLSYVKKDKNLQAKEEFTQNNESKILSDIPNKPIHGNQLINSLLYQFNPIMLLIGLILGLIIYKFFSDAVIKPVSTGISV
jgi:ribosomal protein S17